MSKTLPPLFNPISMAILLICIVSLWNAWTMNALKSKVDLALERMDKIASAQGTAGKDTQNSFQIMGIRLQSMEKQMIGLKSAVILSPQKTKTPKEAPTESTTIIERETVYGPTRSRAIYNGKCTNCF